MIKFDWTLLLVIVNVVCLASNILMALGGNAIAPYGIVVNLIAIAGCSYNLPAYWREEEN